MITTARIMLYTTHVDTELVLMRWWLSYTHFLSYHPSWCCLSTNITHFHVHYSTSTRAHSGQTVQQNECVSMQLALCRWHTLPQSAWEDWSRVRDHSSCAICHTNKCPFWSLLSAPCFTKTKSCITGGGGGSSLHQRGTLFDSPAKLKTLWIPNHERGDSLLFQETCYSLLLLLKCQSSTIFPSPSLAPSLSLPPSLSVLPHAPLPESIPCALTCSSIEFILRAADECFVISNHCIFQDQLCLSQYLQKEVMKMMLIMMHKADF